MNHLNSVLKTIKGRNLKSAIQASTKAAHIQGKIEVLEAVLKQGNVKGVMQPSPLHTDALKREIEVLQQEYDVLAVESIKAAALIQVEGLAKDAGAHNPYLIALAMQNCIKAKIDDYGDVAISIVNEEDAIPRLNPRTGGPYTAGEYIQQMKTSSEHANLFGFDNSVKEHPISNPWKKESFNLTMQGNILKDNPALAARLRAEAGNR